MEIYIGTSGWSYGWNLGNSLEWYVEKTGLHAIELNMSYYRFPFPNMVKSWVKKASSLAWIIKVHRSITHFQKLSPVSYSSFTRFKNLFSPLEKSIQYYLLQLPPKFIDLSVCEAFIDHFGAEKLALEFRHPSLFSKEIIHWGLRKKILLVSIDAPQLPHMIMSKQIIYERIHGRIGWYTHNYSSEELTEIKKRITATHPKKVMIFFNNDHAMLENAKMMMSLFKKIRT